MQHEKQEQEDEEVVKEDEEVEVGVEEKEIDAEEIEVKEPKPIAEDDFDMSGQDVMDEMDNAAKKIGDLM